MQQMFRRCFTILIMVFGIQPALAQAEITVLDQAQDGGAAAQAGTDGQAATPHAAPPICGLQPLSIARMGWPSAAILAEIHVRLLKTQFGCDARIVAGDLAATGSSMGSTGQPAVAPEMWVTRIAEVWNPAIKAQMVRPAASTYSEQVFEGWFMPQFMAEANEQLKTAATLVDVLPDVAAGAKIDFISCPLDWGCAVINRNLIRALGLDQLVNVIEPANRFEMDTLIAAAVSKKQPVLFYYWQPNAVLAQFNFTQIDLGAYAPEAFQCLARVDCAAPSVSSFVPETVVIALSEWVFTDTPQIAAYFQRAVMPLVEMNGLLAQLSEAGATEQKIAERFVDEREDIWRAWVGAAAP